MGETRSSKAAVIEYVMANCGITEPEKCIMVGDREHDVIGAKACGIDCVGVLFGYGTKDELENAGAAFLVETVEELAKVLKNI